MKYLYVTCDVFTETRFGGNPLAVFPHADGLSDQRMQQIAREFNLSESTFVFPAKAGHSRNVRIFMPAREVPFAGHPNVGTAFVLAASGALGEIRSSLRITFEEEAGLVPVTIREANGRITSCELSAPQSLSLGKTISPQLVASAVSLAVEEIATDTHPPQVASTGLPFVMTELRDRSALARARANISAFETIGSEDVRPSIYLYVRSGDDFDIRARMFAPLSGVPEDPATGSASCVLAGLLAHFDAQRSGNYAYHIAQGVEMGRPSTLAARAKKADGEVTETGVGGPCVKVSQGFIEVD
jgi:trans-2,3-dihydro-3-hydroxyanthranilate isomerase